jgi:hypothetical protein
MADGLVIRVGKLELGTVIFVAIFAINFIAYTFLVFLVSTALRSASPPFFLFPFQILAPAE